MPRDKLHLLQLCTTGSIINSERIKVTGNLRSEDKSSQVHPQQSFKTHHKAQDVTLMVITVVLLRKEVLQNVTPCH